MFQAIGADGLCLISRSPRQTIYEGVIVLGHFAKARPLTAVSEESEDEISSGAFSRADQ